MSENQSRNDYSQYDSMTTEELEEILRLDAEAPEGQATDGELLLYILEVLASRKQNSSNPGNTAQQAWESFQKNYLPTEEENITPVTQTVQPAKKPSHWLRRALATAAIIVILIGIPLTARAFSWAELWDAVAKWAKETFSFVSSEDVQLTEPAADDVRQYTSLQELLAETDQEINFVPTWIPDGYQLKDITIDETPMQKNYNAYYHNQENALRICVKSFVLEDPEKIEITDNLIDKIDQAGIEYYIFSNNNKIQVIWIKDSYQCIISGDLTIEEIKTMINSIGKG